jgi:hypothetical protein
VPSRYLGGVEFVPLPVEPLEVGPPELFGDVLGLREEQRREMPLVPILTAWNAHGPVPGRATVVSRRGGCPGETTVTRVLS